MGPNPVPLFKPKASKIKRRKNWVVPIELLPPLF